MDSYLDWLDTQIKQCHQESLKYAKLAHQGIESATERGKAQTAYMSAFIQARQVYIKLTNKEE